MADTTRYYTSEGLHRREPEAASRVSNSNLSAPKSRHTSGDFIVSQGSAVARYGRGDGWDRGASYMENLVLSTESPTLAEQKYTSSLNQSVNPAYLPNVPWDNSKRTSRNVAISNSSHFRPTVNAIDMPVTANHQHHYSHPGRSAGSSSSMPISSSLLSATGAALQHHYVATGTPRISENADSERRRKTTTTPADLFLNAVRKREQTEISRLLETGTDVSQIETALDWQRKLSSENAISRGLALQSLQGSYKTQLFSPFAGNSTQDESYKYSRHLHTNEQSYRTSPAEQQPPSYNRSRYDCFPRPFEHMARPNPGGNLNPPGGIDLTRPTPAEGSSSTATENRLKNRVTSSNVDLAYAHKSPRSYDSPHKEQNSSKRAVNHDLKKPSFLIDEITKRNVNQRFPSKTSTPENFSSSLYAKPTHSSSERHERNAITLGLEQSRVSYPVDLYGLQGQNNVEAQPRLSSASQFSASSLPYNAYLANLTPFSNHPISPILYSPHITPVTLPVPVYTGQSARHDQSLIQRTRSDTNSHHRVPNDPIPRLAAIVNARRESEQRSRESRIQESRSSTGAVGWTSRNPQRHSIYKENSRDAALSKFTQRMSQSDSIHPVIQLPRYSSTVSEATSHTRHSCHSHSNPPDVPKSRQEPTASEQRNHHHIPNMQHLKKQKSKDTDLRPFVSSAAISSMGNVSTSPVPTPAAEKKEHPSSRRRLSMEDVEERNSAKSDVLYVTSEAGEPQLLSSKEFAEENLHHNEADDETNKDSHGSSLLDQNDEKTTKNVPDPDNVPSRQEVQNSDVPDTAATSQENKPEPKPKGRRGRKRKLPAAEAPETTTAKPTNEILPSQTETDVPNKREKRLKSEAEDEYYYDWYGAFSSSETENDDSEDEDFPCPITKSSYARGRPKKSMTRSRPVRKSSRRSRGFFSSGNSSFDEDDVEEEEEVVEKTRLKTRSSSRSKSPILRLAADLDGNGKRKLRKIKKARKISSDSESSAITAEEENKFIPDEKKEPEVPLCRDEKKEEPLVEKKIIKRGRGRKKNSGVTTTPPQQKRPETEKKSPEKKRKMKRIGDKPSSCNSSSQHTNEAKAVETPVKKNEKSPKISDDSSPQKKVRKRVKKSEQSSTTPVSTKDDSKSLEQSMSTDNNAIAKPTDVSTAIESVQANQDPGASENKKNTTSDLSMLLFTGETEANNSVSEAEKSTTVNENTDVEQGLFANDLTETEAQALKVALEKANLDLTNNQLTVERIPETVQKIPSSIPIPTVEDCPALPISEYPSVSASSQQASTPSSSPEKVKKKRGRKSKSQLNAAPAENMTESPIRKKYIVKKKKTDSSTETSPKKLTPKVQKLLIKGKSELVVGAKRKGRPPGSRNKNKLIKLEEKIKKKRGPKPFAKKLAERLAEVGGVAPAPCKPGTAKRGRPATPKKNLKFLHTPLTKQPGRAMTAASSPASSVICTPIVSSKSCAYSSASRSSTPLSFSKDRRTAYFSPLPPNCKKLISNSAIGETVLHKAVKLGCLENVKYYLESGVVKVNAKDNAGYTALHEACVDGRLDAAKILLEFGADVNINSIDGTRPIHDAVDHDHVEMTRLLLACGADPMLSKFSGRALREMIHSRKMGSFLSAYLKTLKGIEEDLSDPDFQWNLPASSILDDSCRKGCDCLFAPPPEDTQIDDVDFQLLEEEPPDSYLVQPTGTSGLANYYLLNEVLEMKNCARAEFLLQYPSDVKTIVAKNLVEGQASNWVRKQNHCLIDDLTTVELISAEKLICKGRLFKVCQNGEVVDIAEKKKPSGRNKVYPCGAFCETTKFAPISFTDAVQIKRAAPLVYEDPDEPCGSLLSRASSNDCGSPMSCRSLSASETTEKQESGDSVESKNNDIFLSDTVQNCNDSKTMELTEITQLNGFMATSRAVNGDLTLPSVGDSQGNDDFQEKQSQNSNDHAPSPYEPFCDIAPYTPSADLGLNELETTKNPDDLTETDRAVLSLTNSNSKFDLYDNDVSLMNLTRAETQYTRFCGRTNNNLYFLNDKTKTSKDSFNHVPDMQETDHAMT